MPSLSKAFFIFADKLCHIIKIFYIIPSILFKVVVNLVDKVLNGITPILPNCPIVKQAVDF